MQPRPNRTVLKRVPGTLAQVLAAVVIIAGLLLGLNYGNRRAEEAARPPDWLVIQPPREVSSLACYDGVLWSGGIDGLLRIDRATGRLLPAAPDLPDTGYVHGQLVSTDDRLWVAAENGVFIHGTGTWQHAAAAGTAPAYCLLEYPRGQIICGTVGGIMDLTGGTAATAIPRELKVHQVNVLYLDGDGILWAGCNKAGHGRLLCYRDGTWNEAAPTADLPHPCINAFATDAGGRLWAGTGFAGLGGPARRVDGVWRSGAGHPVVDGNKVRSLYCDSRGRLWFGMEYDGVIIGVDGSWLELTEADGLAGREVKVVLEDTNNIYWVGTDRGLNRIVLP